MAMGLAALLLVTLVVVLLSVMARDYRKRWRSNAHLRIARLTRKRWLSSSFVNMALVALREIAELD
jgi:hypothetical protein